MKSYMNNGAFAKMSHGNSLTILNSIFHDINISTNIIPFIGCNSCLITYDYH